MRILVIGKSYSTKIFSDVLCKNKDNLVFSTLENTDANFIDINFLDVFQLKEFALANEIELTVLSDFESIEANFVEEFNNAGLSIFAPDNQARKISSNKAFAKKFMYRNKIKTPRFQIFDKFQLAYEYIRNTKYPIVIKSDEHIHPYGTRICETYKSAKETLDDFYQSATRVIIIEDYIQGDEFSIYVITDGFNSFLLDCVSTKQNRYAISGANFIEYDFILNNFVKPTIKALAQSNNHYVGILGIDLVKRTDGEIFAFEYNPFFESLDVNLFANCIETPWEKLFEGAILGTLKDEFNNIKKNEQNCISMITDEGKIEYAKGRTTNEAIENLENNQWKF